MRINKIQLHHDLPSHTSGGGLEKVHQLLSGLIFMTALDQRLGAIRSAFYPGVTVNQFTNLSSAIVLTKLDLKSKLFGHLSCSLLFPCVIFFYVHFGTCIALKFSFLSEAIYSSTKYRLVYLLMSATNLSMTIHNQSQVFSTFLSIPKNVQLMSLLMNL